VNGRVPPPEGIIVDPDHDRVTVSGREIRPVVHHRYLMLNKPLGVITSAKDESDRMTVLDVVGDEGQAGHRLFPVGRLDADSTGLLLLTDDGDLSYRLTHPRYKVPKEYVALVGGSVSKAKLEQLRAGVDLEDGRTAPAEVEVLRVLPGPQSELLIVISEGRHRQVRRMLQAVGHHVQSLKRVSFGPLRLGRLKGGGWRVLVDAEVDALRRASGGGP
jgi:23S rRNA pseudouridine2605 synthase